MPSSTICKFCRKLLLFAFLALALFTSICVRGFYVVRDIDPRGFLPVDSNQEFPPRPSEYLLNYQDATSRNVPFLSQTAAELSAADAGDLPLVLLSAPKPVPYVVSVEDSDQTGAAGDGTAAAAAEDTDNLRVIFVTDAQVQAARAEALAEANALERAQADAYAQTLADEERGAQRQKRAIDAAAQALEQAEAAAAEQLWAEQQQQIADEAQRTLTDEIDFLDRAAKLRNLLRNRELAPPSSEDELGPQQIYVLESESPRPKRSADSPAEFVDSSYDYGGEDSVFPLESNYDSDAQLVASPLYGSNDDGGDGSVFVQRFADGGNFVPFIVVP